MATEPDGSLRTGWHAGHSLPAGSGKVDRTQGVASRISFAKDREQRRRYKRIDEMWQVAPKPRGLNPGQLGTIHCDTWRGYDASYGPRGLDDFIGQDEELFCGGNGDRDYWASHGLSFSIEGPAMQPALLMGITGYFWRGGSNAPWNLLNWGKIVTTHNQGDIHGGNRTMHPAQPETDTGRVDWGATADDIYINTRIFNLLYTSELLTLADSSLTPGNPGKVFANGGYAGDNVKWRCFLDLSRCAVPTLKASLLFDLAGHVLAYRW